METDDIDQLDADMAGEVERPKTKQGLNEYEKALWKWVNVQDLDAFLQEVCRSNTLVRAA